MALLAARTISDRLEHVGEITRDDSADFIRDLAKELSRGRRGTPGQGMRSLDDFTPKCRDFQFERAMDLGTDIERRKKGDAHSHRDHVAQRVEAGAFIVAANMRAETDA